MTAPDDTNCDGMMCVVHCANKLKCSGHDDPGSKSRKAVMSQRLKVWMLRSNLDA